MILQCAFLYQPSWTTTLNMHAQSREPWACMRLCIHPSTHSFHPFRVLGLVYRSEREERRENCHRVSSASGAQHAGILIDKLTFREAISLSLFNTIPAYSNASWLSGRRVRHSLETQASYPHYRVHSTPHGVLCGGRQHARCRSPPIPRSFGHLDQSWFVSPDSVMPPVLTSCRTAVLSLYVTPFDVLY